jgi:RNA polymerase primary sigma factor
VHGARTFASGRKRPYRGQVTVESDILFLSDDLRQLVEASEERGSVLQSDLSDVLEPLQLDPIETDAVYRELETRSIDVVDDQKEDEVLNERRRAEQQPVPVSWETTTDALQLFLREAGRHPLLTAAQEVALAKKVERGDFQAKQRMSSRTCAWSSRSPRTTAIRACRSST